MKKKIVAMCATVAIAAVAVGGTLAYFTDADKDVNVMTSGNVTIVQNETDRAGKAYEDGQKLYPAVYLDAEGNPYKPGSFNEGPGAYEGVTGPDGNNMNMYTSRIENEIDKVVSVTNKGSEPAYVRTIILIENTDHLLKGSVHLNWDKGVSRVNAGTEVVVDGVVYEVHVCTYPNALEVGKTSGASLKQIWLDPTVGSDWYSKLGTDGKLSIIALSQAVQTEGFDKAETALDTAFGAVTAENLEKWVAETVIDTTGENNVVAAA